MKILFLGKKNDYYAKLAVKIFKDKKCSVQSLFIDKNANFDKKTLNWKGDYIISYLCPIKVPAKLIKNANKIAINFHPGPPEYPGIGCTNYAIYNEDKNYGVTCHIMTDKIDDGLILSVKRFRMKKNETLFSLTMQSYKKMYELFIDISNNILSETSLVVSNKYKWKGKAKTRADFLDFLKLNTNMSHNEIKKRIFSTTYPGFDAAYFNIKGIKFFGKIDD